MSRIPNTIKPIVLSVVLVMLSVTAFAQYRKPLPSGKYVGQQRDAAVNIGILGGTNFTYWYHARHPMAADWYLQDYQPQFKWDQFKLGYFGGIALEFMLSNNFSLGLNAVYNQHNLRMQYINEHFPSHWDNEHNEIVYIQRTYTLESEYKSVELYLPLTYYLTLPLNKNIKPYFYVAPRASYTLDGQMKLTKTDLLPDQQGDPITYPMGPEPFADTLRFNYGATVGLGTQFKIDLDSYYLLMKFDVSANVYLRQTFNKMDLTNEFNYKRYFTDAQATFTFMLPLKKQLRDACYGFNYY